MRDFYTHFRKHQYTTVLALFLLLTDVILLSFVFDFFYQFVPSALTLPLQEQKETFIFLSVILTLCWLLSNLLVSAYQVDKLGTYRKIIYNAFKAGLVYAILILVLLSLMGVRQSFLLDASLIGELYFATFIPVVLLRCVMLRFYRFYRHLSFNQTKVIIIGCTMQGIRLYEFFVKNPSLPHKFMGFFDEQKPFDLQLSGAYKGDLEDVKEYCLKNDIKEIYYTLPNHRIYLTDLAHFADQHFIYLGIVPDMGGMDFIGKRKIDTQLYDDGKIPILSSRNVPLRLMVNAHVKRAFDIAFSSVVLLVLSITLFPIIALAIKLESKGPVFFAQLRPGKYNRLFWCYKFRTMRVNNEIEKQATKDDQRITRVGKFLRKTSLDELPQFFNVLKGDMSVVGPRPNMISQLDYYSREIREYPLRHFITPGITGYAQVKGYRGETQEVYLMEKRVQYDLWYIENWSFQFDLQIIGQTVINMIKGEEKAY